MTYGYSLKTWNDSFALEREAKYFNSIQGWRIENLSQAPQASNLPPVDQFQPATNVSDDEPDDLPF